MSEEVEEVTNPKEVIDLAMGAKRLRVDCGSKRQTHSLRTRLDRLRSRMAKRQAQAEGIAVEASPLWALSFRESGQSVVIENTQRDPMKVYVEED